MLAVGNDFNDLDLLHWAGKGYAVANSPDPIRALFPLVPSNDERRRFGGDQKTYLLRASL